MNTGDHERSISGFRAGGEIACLAQRSGNADAAEQQNFQLAIASKNCNGSAMNSRVDQPLSKSVEAIRTLYRQPEKLTAEEMLALLPAEDRICHSLRKIIAAEAKAEAPGK